MIFTAEWRAFASGPIWH